MRFEWDPHKAEINFRKHGVLFNTATRVFSTPKLFFGPLRFVDFEERWSVVGEVGRLTLYVAFTTEGDGDDETIRIISARIATRHERRELER